MLAAISPPAHDLSQSMPYSHTRTTSRSTLPDLGSTSETKTCPGCQQTVMDENGGVVIAFGQSFFHVDCFKCAKCQERVTADTNLLLLSDGQPVCSNCSYKCSVCHQPILDEAIMTGDDSYHAHCFKCRSCNNRIDELMFAKTSHGIYCMKCHNQRVARSRRHAQKQKERENSVAGGGSNSHGVPTKQPPTPHGNAPPGHISPDSLAKSLSVSAASSAQTSQAAELDRDQERPHITVPVQSLHRTGSDTSPLTTSSSPQADPAVPQTYSSGSSSPVIVVPPDGPEAGLQVALSYLQREDSNDSGGTTPFLTANGSLPDSTHLVGLSSSRAGKHNSINPGMSFNYEAVSKELNRKKSVSAPQSPSSPQLPTIDVGQNSSLVDPQPLLSREQISEGLARRPSRKARTEAPTSTPTTAGSMLSRSRSRTEVSSSTDPRGPLSRQNTMLERLPPRMHSLKASGQDPEALARRPSLMASAKSSSLGRSSSDEKDGHKPGSSLSIDVEKSRAANVVGKRPVSPAYKAGSPAHKVDVPRGIESGTDTSDGEREPSTKERTRKSSLSSSKEKEAKKSRRQPAQLDLETAQSASQEEPGDDSFLNNAGDVDTEDESSPVERMSRSTFIAPAHPPIRFSVSGNGFQELLSQFDPRDPSSFSALGELLKMNEDAESRNDAGSSATPLNPDGGAASNEGGPLSSTSSAATPTTVFGFSNSSVTTISAPSSQGHEDSFLVLDQPGTTNGIKSDLLQRQRNVRNTSSTSSSRSSLEKSRDPPASDDQQPSPQFTATTSESATDRPAKLDQAAAVMKRLKDALQDTARRGMTQITLDQEFVQAMVMMIEQRRDENAKMKSKLDHIKRASQQAMDGLTVAHNECEAELRVRREAETEVTRLRILLSGQAARITALSGQGRREEQHKQLIHDLRENLNVLEHDVAKLKVDRDLALAEMEEIASSRSSEPTTDRDGTTLGRSLSTQLDNLKAQYRSELMSLSGERESLLREIAELQIARNVFLEETTMLNVRNEELAHLNAHYMRRIEVAASSESLPPVRENLSFERHRPAQPLQPSHTANASIGLSSDESHESAKYVKVQQVQQKSTTGDAPLRVFKWRGNHKEGSTASLTALDGPNEKSLFKHAFQNFSVLRFLKCDHCNEKLWGSQARCQLCNISVHPRCQPNVHVICSPQNSSRRDDVPVAGPLQPVMFGRELTEQVRADSKISDRMVPLIVEKCIAAVDASALDYEGIYRKTGGSGQSKLITQLFERGDYAAFDLLDTERFNDICSTTSVLKTYFRTLPNPLLTFVLHDEFIFASSIQDPVHRSAKYADLVKQLPTEHYYTLRILMLHLYRIQNRHEQNLMTARNLGVVFGPTLMRSRNPAAEFSDMAGKALTIEWLVENAPTIFPPLPMSSH